MSPELQERFLRVAQRLERLDRLHTAVSNAQNTSARALIASASVASAEFLAAATGHGDDVGIIHRAYEEVFAALETSAAVRELFANTSRVAELQNDKASQALARLQEFRLQLMNGDSHE